MAGQGIGCLQTGFHLKTIRKTVQLLLVVRCPFLLAQIGGWQEGCGKAALQVPALVCWSDQPGQKRAAPPHIARNITSLSSPFNPPIPRGSGHTFWAHLHDQVCQALMTGPGGRGTKVGPTGGSQARILIQSSPSMLP